MNRGRQAFDALYDAHFDAIYRYVLRRVADVNDAEDLTAETFFKALKSFWRVRFTGGNPSAWLYRIATNEVNSYYRARGVRTAKARARIEATEAMVSERRDAESELAKNRLFLDLHQALQRLPPNDQALIVLRYFEQQPYEAITRILGGRPGMLATRANRALKKLKNLLEQRGVDHEELRGILAAAERPGPAGRGLPAEAAP